MQVEKELRNGRGKKSVLGPKIPCGGERPELLLVFATSLPLTFLQTAGRHPHHPHPHPPHLAASSTHRDTGSTSSLTVPCQPALIPPDLLPPILASLLEGRILVEVVVGTRMGVER